MRLSSSPEDESELKVGTHVQTRGKIRRLGQYYDVIVDMDTGAAVGLVSDQWARDHELKQYKRRLPQLLAGIGPIRVKVKGAYWVRYTLQDSNGTVREHYRPFLAVDRELDKAPLLLGNPDLCQIDVSLDLLPY